MKSITIYHTNDIHSNIERFASIVTYLNANKSKDDLLLDAGDFCDFKSTMINGTQGRAGKALLGHAGYDALCIGNNEGFSGIEAVEAMGEDKVPLLSINLTKLDGTYLKNVQKSVILNKSGYRFLIIGVSPYYGIESAGKYNVFFNMENLHVQDPIPLIKVEMETMKGLYDFVILLSHQGDYTDQRLAREIDGIDIIIGGHSHTVMNEPHKVRNTFIHQAGEYGNLIGKLELLIEEDKIIEAVGTSIPNLFTEDPETMALIKKQTEIAITNLSKTLFTIDSLNHSLSQESELANFICDALRKEQPCDFALINHGIVNHGLSGEISKMKLLETSPSPLNPTLIKVKGKNVLEALKLSLDQDYIHRSGRGPGFRGTHIGALAFSSNVKIQSDPLKVVVDGEALDPDREYTVMANDYLQRGSGYPCLAYPDGHSTYFSGYIRDLLERNLHDDTLIVSAKQSRRISAEKRD